MSCLVAVRHGEVMTGTILMIRFSIQILLHSWHSDIKAGPIVRIAAYHISFSDDAVQKTIYGFGTKSLSSMKKGSVFFTPEVDHSTNMINECDKDKRTRMRQMRRMLSYDFSTSNLLQHEEVLIRRIDEFLDVIGNLRDEDGKKGIDAVRQFDHVTFMIMGETSFDDSWDARLQAQPGTVLIPFFLIHTMFVDWPEIMQAHRYH